ncbi:hypothetical protein [Mesorhizobium sp. LNJC405B00]|uniref:hypothetical protein n=1 Tax=Mesorhizobium sp. LNJC405B00 TaxID=1287281 RepID=UPI0003CEA758|nr:hypothetical protein [Mesorhizobium sp. LNJC405B00]ESX99111.1 hypothetical protein X755_12505 [Mesorhizobium sp. LNJC405B00]
MSLAYEGNYQPTDLPKRFRYGASYGEKDAIAVMTIRSGFINSDTLAAAPKAESAGIGLNGLAWACLAIIVAGLVAVFFTSNVVAAAVLPLGLVALTVVGFFAKRRDLKR